MFPLLGIAWAAICISLVLFASLPYMSIKGGFYIRERANFCSGVILPKSINDLAKVKQLNKTPYDLAKAGSFAKLYRVLPKSIGVSPNSVWEN